MVIRQSNGSLPSMAVSSHRGWAWYLLITVQWLSLLTKAFRWDISAVSSCSFEKRFVNCHFELNIQRILTTTWHLTSRSIWALSLVLWSHSFKLHKVKTNLLRVYDLLAIFNISWYCENRQFWHIMLQKKMIASRAMVFGISCSPSPFLIALATGRSGISSPAVLSS